MAALPLVLPCWFMSQDLRDRGMEPGRALELIFAAGLGGFVGARVYYVLENPDRGGGIFSGSGLVWYGGLIGGVIGVAALSWWRRLPLGGVGERGRAGAGPRLRRRALRLPARRRRGLRHPQRRAVGDELSGRHGADEPHGPAHAPVRDRGVARRVLAPLAPAGPPDRAVEPVRPLLRACRGRALPGRVRAPEPGGDPRAHGAAAVLGGAGGGGDRAAGLDVAPRGHPTATRAYMTRSTRRPRITR